MEQETFKNQIKDLFNQIKEYLHVRTELISLQLRKATIQIISQAVSSLSILVVLALALLFGSLAGAYYLGALMGSTYKGFLIVATFYFLITFILYIQRNSFKKYISNKIIQQLFNEEEQEDEDA